jgi:acyl-CoA thioester hydrolase
MVYTTRIYYQDTDAGGVVYYANYLKFFEKSWFEFLLSAGISLPEWEKKGVFLIVRKAVLHPLKRVQYGDRIEVRTSLKSLANASFVLEHTILRDGDVTTRGETEMVCIDDKGKPKRLPEDYKARLSECLRKTN